MRRDYLDVTVDVDAGGRPAVTVESDGPEGLARDRLTGSAGRENGGVDVALRLQEPPDGDRRGVLAVTARATGEFLLEADLSPAATADLLAALDGRSADADEADGYRLAVTDAGETYAFEKRTLLVYDGDGDLARSLSLIPGEVEL
jgi:hypothetical protein